MTETTPKSRLPRTGIILLLAVVLLIGGGVLMVWGPSYREQQARAEISRLGGKSRSEIVRPLWIPEAVGDEDLAIYARVCLVDLSHTQVSDTGLEHIGGLIHLRTLRLNNTPVGNAGLEHLQGLANLDTLFLNNTQVSDAGLESLRGLTHFIEISLENSHVTQAGIDKLKQACPCFIRWTPPSE